MNIFEVKDYLDNKEITTSLNESPITILPNRSKTLELSVTAFLSCSELDKEHTLKVVIAKKFQFTYTIPPAKISLKIHDLQFREFLDTKYVDNATVAITNTGNSLSM